MVVVSAANTGVHYNISRLIPGRLKPWHEYEKLQSSCHCSVGSKEASFSQRHFLICVGASLVATFSFNNGFLTTLPSLAEDKMIDKEEEEGQGIIGAFKSMFDPNEKTKSGKVLPKAYLKSAREVVKTLRKSLKEDLNDITKFRRTADAAKESIRDYLSSWRGQEKFAHEESYVELEKVLRALATFYSKSGPSAPLPEEIKSEILDDLNRAEEHL